MSISRTTPEETTSGHLFCPQCNAALPLHATFCSFCGERLKNKQQATAIDEQDITNRYRITTLVRRRPYTNLYFALDNEQAQARMVAIRDIEIAGLDKETRERAIVLAQQEYDQLRRWHIPHLLACIDLRVFQGHLFLVSGLPISVGEKSEQGQRLYTLQDFLQSGLGLPRETRTLEWIRNLCLSVERLHRQHIVLGDLDPYTVILNKNSAQAEPRLMPFWMPPALEKLLPRPESISGPQVSYFKAPEALVGKAEARSDVYSLGALLYLLLSGTPPDESTLRHRRRLRTPREINSRISQHMDECVMQALAVEPEERFSSVAAFMAALNDPHFSRAPRKASSPTADIPASEAETIRIVPLSQKDVMRWRAARAEQQARDERGASALSSRPLTVAPPADRQRPAGYHPQAPENIDTLPITPLPGGAAPRPVSHPLSQQAGTDRYTPPTTPAAPKPAWPKHISSILPVVKPEQAKKEKARKKKTADEQAKSAGETSLLKQLQRLFLGQQQHMVEAAAIIETPMRIRPDQPYNIRLHLMGRDEPTRRPGAKKGEEASGLSALVHGEIALVEVRSVLQQGYTYVLQQARVTIPAAGYAAEVTIPMQQQPGAPTGRRDRLHIFFMDEHRNPLYEKPFVVELFVSPLVQFGREGHQVLTIPI